ncbi:MAG: hypothetical protein K2J89_04110, partial [Clostridia bacterium]|nr:hypothetical protein [Clostridia bacterium]
SYGKEIPYTLIADTFYWIDNYNKWRFGVRVDPEEYEHGLNRYNPTETDNNQGLNSITNGNEKNLKSNKHK